MKEKNKRNKRREGENVVVVNSISVKHDTMILFANLLCTFNLTRSIVMSALSKAFW